MEITANAIQTVAVNQNVLFTETPVRGNCAMHHREGSGLVDLKGSTKQARARYKVTFGGNIAVPTGQSAVPIQLAIAINGEAVDTTTMITGLTIVERYSNVASSIFIDVPCSCCYTISVKNTSTIPVNVANANLIVERVA